MRGTQTPTQPVRPGLQEPSTCLQYRSLAQAGVFNWPHRG